MNDNIKIFSGRSSNYLARQIAEELSLPLGKVNFIKFSDGEIQPSFEESVRGSYVFLVQSTFPPTDNIFELLLMIDAAKRASAYKIAAVIPYFGYARQDRKDKPRTSIASKLIADMLAKAGATRVMTMDLHADQIQGFFDIPVDHLYASSIFVPYIESLGLEDMVFASPDMGGSKRAHAYSNYFHTPLAICHKARVKHNEIAEMRIIGDIKNKNVIIMDDIIDTAGTICKAANLFMENGAKSVRAAVTHPVLSGPAYENIDNSPLCEVIVSNTIPLKQNSNKITVLNVSKIFANVMQDVYFHKSISKNFIF